MKNKNLTDAEYSAEMARRARLNTKPRYFATVDKDTLIELSKKGGKRGKNPPEEASTQG